MALVQQLAQPARLVPAPLLPPPARRWGPVPPLAPTAPYGANSAQKNSRKPFTFYCLIGFQLPETIRSARTADPRAHWCQHHQHTCTLLGASIPPTGQQAQGQPASFPGFKRLDYSQLVLFCMRKCPSHFEKSKAQRTLVLGLLKHPESEFPPFVFF